MVKAKPRIGDRAARRRLRFEKKLQAHHRHFLELASFSSSSLSIDILHQQSNCNSTNPTQETLTQKSPVTPSSLPLRKRKRSRSKSNPRFSPLSSHSLSSSSSSSSSSFSPPLISLSFLNFTPSPASKSTAADALPELSPPPQQQQLPPLPPHPSPKLLKRSASDPVTTLLPHLSKSSSSSCRAVSRNLIRQLPPLPPSSSLSPSPSKILKRTIFDPIQSTTTCKEEDEDEDEKRMKMKVENVVNFKCECGKELRFLVQARTRST